MVPTPAQSSIKSSPNSKILRQRPSPDNSCTYCTLGLSFEGCFLVFHLFGELLKNRLIERNIASTPVCSKITYEKYVRFCFRRVFLVFHLFGELLKNRLFERNTASEALRDKIAECSFVLYKRVGEKYFYCNLPLLTCLDFGVCNAIRLVRFGYVLLNAAHTAVHYIRVWVSRPYCHSERCEESSVAKCGLRLDSSALLGMTRGRM